jgi:hypothetical protein
MLVRVPQNFQLKHLLPELKDENLPFEKSVFASAVKKSLQDGISKI